MLSEVPFNAHCTEGIRGTQIKEWCASKYINVFSAQLYWSGVTFIFAKNFKYFHYFVGFHLPKFLEQLYYTMDDCQHNNLHY